jgi:nucleotide-binding universal stress UspA family protein
MYSKALVPLDGSPVAETIIPFILQIAGPLDIEVALLRVVQPQVPVVVEGSPHVELENVEARMTDAREYLAALAAELRGKGLRVTTAVRRGPSPPDEILAAAREAGAALIAMSTHGRSGLGRLLFGSVAEAVLRHAAIPVFLMKSTEAQVAQRAGARG